MKYLLSTLALLIIFTFIEQESKNAKADVKLDIRLGVLEFGTVNWELAVLKQQNLLNATPIQLKLQTIANPQAGKVALLSGSVDMVVADWVWGHTMAQEG